MTGYLKRFFWKEVPKKLRDNTWTFEIVSGYCTPKIFYGRYIHRKIIGDTPPTIILDNMLEQSAREYKTNIDAVSKEVSNITVHELIHHLSKANERKVEIILFLVNLEEVRK